MGFQPSRRGRHVLTSMKTMFCAYNRRQYLIRHLKFFIEIRRKEERFGQEAK